MDALERRFSMHVKLNICPGIEQLVSSATRDDRVMRACLIQERFACLRESKIACVQADVCGVISVARYTNVNPPLIGVT